MILGDHCSLNFDNFSEKFVGTYAIITSPASATVGFSMYSIACSGLPAQKVNIMLKNSRKPPREGLFRRLLDRLYRFLRQKGSRNTRQSFNGRAQRRDALQ